ncbi:response regulator transcription factor [Cohnella phaseoli]|uniref:Two-component system response regulator YesN n=1 Tax=Cohnella phaseoli TaxID=456490 RepID=A0A3D9IP57_9BACL|nr:response regulator [Cohnella phaseoli]RED63531.1 two-component system response regulator YesN [Cohnella phaseoli]
MYKVMLVDDEKIILDGISQMIDWASLETQLIGTASNGVDAFEKVKELQPDIVVSDIRMPGMDGLELVAAVHRSYPSIRFVLLSGFGEFDYASRAMQYGVKHYLLKPTNENKIAEALKEIVTELESDQQRERFVSTIKQGLQKAIPHVKQQVLKEFVTNKTYGSRDWDYYRELFQFEFESPVRLLLFQLEGAVEFEHLFAIKNIAEDLLDTTLLSTTIGDHVLVLVEDTLELSELYRRIHDIRDTFLRYYKLDATIALSEPDGITQARSLYQETLQSLNYRFYLGEGGLITRKDTGARGPEATGHFDFEEEKLTMPVQSGHREEAEQALSQLMDELMRAKLDIHVTKTYVIQQFVSLLRLGDPQQINRYYGRLSELVGMNTLQAIQELLENTVREIVQYHYERNVVKHTSIVRKVIDIVNEQLGNSELSLNQVAGEMLYMNADYLGKLFKKETGEKFSNYVVKARVKKATEMWAANPEIKIFEMAEMLGFGDNPQYFSQVFKKQMGCTPSEYAKQTDNSAF